MNLDACSCATMPPTDVDALCAGKWLLLLAQLWRDHCRVPQRARLSSSRCLPLWPPTLTSLFFSADHDHGRWLHCQLPSVLPMPK